MMKLYYFDLAGKAESIRLLLTHAGVKFEDIRFNKDTWAASYKDKFELKQVPVLEVDGKKYCQSYAILEYLGARYGYLPKNYEGMYRALFVMNTAEDLVMSTYLAVAPTSPLEGKAKEEAKEKLLSHDATLSLDALENQLKQNCSQDFMVGRKYSIADFHMLGFYQIVMTYTGWKEILGEKIAKMPLLKAYFEKRIRDFNPYYKKCQTKLYYFDCAGRAEMIRVMLKYLGLPYEDIRIKHEDWAKEKISGKFPLQQLPVVICEPCGSRMCQSDAIMHKIGARFGMLPTKNPEKLYKVIWWCNTLKDLTDGMVGFFYSAAPEEKRKVMRKDYFAKTVPTFLEAMENRLKLNKTQCYLVGSSYTIADFYLIGAWRGLFANPMLAEFKEIMPKYPTLCQYFEKKDKLF